jgi:hypothetical protein
MERRVEGIPMSVDAWAFILRPPDWSLEKADRLRALIQR